MAAALLILQAAILEDHLYKPCYCHLPQTSVSWSRASLSGDVSKASTQVLGPHNAFSSGLQSSLLGIVDVAKRDSSLVASRTQPQPHAAEDTSSNHAAVFELGGRFETRSLVGLANELFRDPAFMELCDKGLNGTLQRTKDGATAESRIQELAGNVFYSC